MCYKKSFWLENRFRNIQIGEDSQFVMNASSTRIGILDDNRMFVGRVHSKNTSRKFTRGSRWSSASLEIIRSLIGRQWRMFCEAGPPE
jgi:hypothetical protein